MNNTSYSRSLKLPIVILEKPHVGEWIHNLVFFIWDSKCFKGKQNKAGLQTNCHVLLSYKLKDMLTANVNKKTFQKTIIGL
jgi:hypothetical protein